MSVDIRRLSDELRRSLMKGESAHLTPEDTDIALAALRAVAVKAERRNLEGRSPAFQIELIDDQGWPIEVLATIVDGAVAHATFAAVVAQRPDRKIRLRLGPRVLADSRMAADRGK
jgi:hypothetical protein